MYRYFKNKIRIVLVVVGVVTVVLGIAILVPHKTVLPALMLMAAVIFVLVIYPMVFHYLFLISVHLTEKEYVSRKQAC